MVSQPNLSSAAEMTGFLLPIYTVFEAGPSAPTAIKPRRQGRHQAL